MRQFTNLSTQESNIKMMTKISSSLFDIPIINSVIEYDCTDSTNIKAKDFAKRGSVHGTLFIAHKQTAGKGRIGRSFESPKDEGIYMSLLLRPQIELTRLSNITLIVAVALSRAIKDVCHINTQIKWPNDIVSNGKKLVGILTESGTDYVVIGIGINVNNTEFPENIAKTATSIRLETGNTIDNFKLIYSILENLNSLYDEFISNPNISFLLEEYNSLLANRNQEVYIIPHNISTEESNPYAVDTSGLTPLLCKGIDSYGNLICKDSYNNTIPINSGEVSLRGTMGYI